MLEIAAESGGLPRAFVRVGSSTVAGQQLAIALALGCERVVCVAPALTPDIVALQHRAEKAGAQFHVIPGTRPLLGLVTAADEIIAFADGLFASRERARALLESAQCVLVQPIEQGLAAGFERIDLNHAAAGAMRLPGRLVERLAELPADCDLVSSLQRIALQAGLRQVPIGPIAEAGELWALVHGEAEALALEPQWIRQHTGASGPAGPSQVIASLGVRSFGPAMLHAGTGSGALLAGSLVCAVLAIGAGWLGLAALGLGFCALGWLLHQSAAIIARVETEDDPGTLKLSMLSAYGWIIDGLLVTLLGWAPGASRAMPLLDRFFPALMLVVLLRILSGLQARRWNAWIGDRGLAAAALIGPVAAGFADPVAHLGAIAAAALVLVAIGGESRLTRP